LTRTSTGEHTSCGGFVYRH